MTDLNPIEALPTFTLEDIVQQKLAIGQYRFTLEALEPISVPDFAGSLLRGSFGWALRALTCITKAETCQDCPLYEVCHYPKLFNPKPSEALAKRFPSIPAPYLFVPPHHSSGELVANQKFIFNLILFGQYAISQLPLIIFAWQRASYRGLGKGKAQAQLLSVDHVGPQGIREIYVPEEVVQSHDATITVEPFNETVHSITLEIVTPMRIQHENKLLNGSQLNAMIFLNALQRKVLLYSACHLGMNMTKLPLADGIGFEAKLFRRNFYRYSNRQKQKMNLEGLVGTIHLTGDLTQWGILLKLGQYTHIGKNTSFGLGEYKITHINGSKLTG